VRFLLLLSYILIGFFGYSQQTVRLDRGVLDLSSWNPESSPYVTLEGEAEFCWMTFHEVESDSSKVEFRDCSKNWNSYKGGNAPYPAIGYATYRIHIINVPDVELNLMLRNVTCAADIYIGEALVGQIGEVGRSQKEEEPKYLQKIVPLPSGERKVDLTIVISNHNHRKGGFNDPIYIGTESALYAFDRKNMMVNSLQASAFLFAGLFFITLYGFRRKDKALLYFALYAITFSVRPMVSGEYSITGIWPGMNWSLLIYTEYLSLFLSSGFLLLFVRERYRVQAPRKLLWTLSMIIFLEAILTIFLPTTIFTFFPLIHQIISVFGFVALLIVIARVLRQRVSGALFATSAVFCLIASSLYTILLFFDLIAPAPYTYLGLQMAFLLSMTMILGSKFASQFRKVEYLQAETAEQKNEIESQHVILEKKNEEVIASLTYAKRIQAAILPSERILKEVFNDVFVLYKPKDIVAGDFYWLDQTEENLFIAVADCTGHGVPGAMVSVVCNDALNRCIHEFNLSEPGAILTKARDLVIETFDQSDEVVNDGMDIALCSINKTTGSVIFSGAQNPLWLVTDGTSDMDSMANRSIQGYEKTLLEFKGDKQPVGRYDRQSSFTSIELKVNSGDWIYLFSDGFADQFGGERNKKFMYKPFKHLLLQLSESKGSEQKDSLENELNAWIGNNDQTDDICVLGFRVK